MIDDTVLIINAAQLIRMGSFQENKKKKIKENDCTYTLTVHEYLHKGNEAVGAEARIRVGLIVGPTVLSYQYSFLVYFHCTFAHFIPLLRSLFFPSPSISFIPLFSVEAKYVIIYIASLCYSRE